MLELVERLDNINKADDAAHSVTDTLTLPYELRVRGRLKATTDKGQEVGLFLERGQVLNDGSLLKAKTGEVIKVLAADEDVTTAYTESGLPHARLCYHLGNRHVPLAIGYDEADSESDRRYWVRFAPDHVLEELAELLGATLTHHKAPFDPESGAYAHADKGKFLGHSHGHSHDHGHSHGHHHDH